MEDLIFIGITLLFFLASGGFVVLYSRFMEQKI